MKKLLLCWFILLLCFADSTWAQQLYFNHLTVNNGLSQGVNNCIFRDSKGFIWISSFDGLNRFDGVSCISFRSSVNEATGLKGTLFLNILEDKNSNLWIGSNSGLNFYNRNLDRFQNFRIENRSNDEQFYSPFYIDDKNNIWLQSSSDIILFNSTTQTFTFFDHFFSPGNLLVKPVPASHFQPLKKIIAVNNNTAVLWEGIVTGNKLNWSSKKIPLSTSRITAFLQEGDNHFWIGTNNGLFHLQNKNQSTVIEEVAVNKIKHISVLHLDQKGTLWAGTLQDGLFTIDTAGRQVKDHYTNSVYNSYTISGNQVQYINTDEKGDLWISIWGKGVDYTSLNKFRFNHHVTKEEAVAGGADNFIRSIIQVKNEFWCGTQTGGILILDEQKKIKQVIRNGIPPSIEHLCLDNNNRVWAATLEGLFLVDPQTKEITKLPVNTFGLSPASNQYNYISLLQNGSMIASTNAGLFIIEKSISKFSIKPAKGISARDVYLTTYTDQLNQLYISRAFKGFSVYRLTGDSLYLLKELPMEATIKCFRESTDSTLWIGSTTGLIRYNKYKLQLQQLITTKQGLSNQYIYGIVADGNNLWLSTNAGINRFDSKTNTVKIFSAGDGLQSNEYNTYSFCKSNSGEILFGGVNGLNSFYPSALKSNSYPPQLILTELQLNDTSYKPPFNRSEIKELVVDYNQNTIGFQFTVVHYSNATANTLSYTLEGYDKTWVTIPNKSLIRYANLPSAEYVLKVKAMNADGIEAETIYSLPVTVKVPWWQSWWFRLLVSVAVIGIIILIVRNYIGRKLEKQKTALEKQQAVEKERNRISRDMHDDLGSGLTKIAILSEVVKKQLSVPEKAKEQLDKIAVSSRELVDNLQDIIWVLNPKNDTLENLSSYIREYGLKYFEALTVQITFNYPEHFSAVKLSEEQRRNIFLTVKESFNNIAKHAYCNHITVTIAETTGEILLQISDDGKGFDVNRVRLFANGLRNMQNRIEQVGGQYSIVSKPGGGTITEIKFSV